MADKNKLASCSLPISRIRMIMKSSPEVSNINPDALFMIAKSTELFIEDLSNQILNKSDEKKQLDYNTLAEMVDTEETLAFLQDIVPKKIKYKDFLAMKERKKKHGDNDEDD